MMQRTLITGTSVTSLESTVDKTTGIGKEFYLVLPSNTETGKITFEIPAFCGMFFHVVE